MPTFRLTLEYDGHDYSGWQRQPDRRTVEGVLRAAIAAVTGEEPALTAAGRTDAGAHAHGQVVGCRLERTWRPERLLAALNSHLPKDVSVRDIAPAAEDFHARFDAVARTYRYVVVPRAHRSPLARRYAWQVQGELDLGAMRNAADRLVGTHDFAAFGRAPNGSGTTVRTVHDVTVRRIAAAAGEDCELGAVVVEVNANAFLYGMMRSFAGALVTVGQGKMAPAEITRLLRAGGRQADIAVAPAHGLHQWTVTYS